MIQVALQFSLSNIYSFREKIDQDMHHKWNRKSARDYTQFSNLCFGLLQCPVILAELLGDVPIVGTLSKRERECMLLQSSF